jgi:hypothetical protein
LWREAKMPKSNVQNTPFSKHFDMFQKCTLLWREADFQVKIFKAPHHVRATFGRSPFGVAGATDYATCPK